MQYIFNRKLRKVDYLNKTEKQEKGNKMNAILKYKGFQYEVKEGGIYYIPKTDIEPGEKIKFDEILLLDKGDEVIVGQPFVKNAEVEAVVLDNVRGKKIIGFKYKRRKKYRRRWGHRQDYTEIKIEKIKLNK